MDSKKREQERRAELKRSELEDEEEDEKVVKAPRMDLSR